jgi:hypothetical protein
MKWDREMFGFGAAQTNIRTISRRVKVDPDLYAEDLTAKVDRAGNLNAIGRIVVPGAGLEPARRLPSREF